GCRNFFEFFRNERVQTTSLGPRIMIKLVSQHLVDTAKRLQKGVSGCNKCMSLACRNNFKFSRNKRVQTTSFGPRIMLKLISHHLVDARNGCKWGYLGAINAIVWGAITFTIFFATN